MSIFLRKLAVCLVLFFVTLSCTNAGAEENYEVAQRARQVIQGYVNDIGKAGGEVGTALGNAVGGSVGDLDKWQEVTTQVDRYQQTFSGVIPLLDQHVRTLLEAAPGSDLPSMQVGDPFNQYIEQAKTRIREIKTAQNKENARLAKLDQEIAKFENAVVSSTRQSFNEVIEGFLPTEEQLAAEGATVLFGAYFGPPGIVAAGIAVGATITFNGFVNLYYNAKGLGAQGKVLADMLSSLRERRRAIQEAVDSYAPAMQEMQKIEQDLQRHRQVYVTLNDRLQESIAGWRNLAGEAADKKRQKEAQEYAELRNKQAPPVGVGPPRRPYCTSWIGAIKPLESRDYQDEANSLLSGLEGTMDAAMDGGDPTSFFDKGKEEQENFIKRLAEARKQVEKGIESLCEAQHNLHFVTMPPIWKQYQAMLPPPFCYACGVPSDYYAKVQAAEQYLRSASEQAQKPLFQLGKSVGEIIREQSRISQVYMSYMNGYYYLHNRLYQYARLRALELTTLRSSWSDTCRAAANTWSTLYYNTFSYIESQANGYRYNAERLDETVSGALGSGNPPAAILVSLKSAVSGIQDLAATYGALIPKLETAANEANQCREESRGEIEAFLDKYGPLFMGLSMLDPDQELERLRFYFPEEITMKTVKKPDFSKWQSAYQNKIAEVAEWADWVDFYEGRLSVAQFRINRLSHEAIEQGFYERMPIIYELTAKPPWQNLAAQIQSAIDPAEHPEPHRSNYTGWQKLPPYKQLRAVFGSLKSRLNYVLRLYLKFKEKGTFAHATDHNELTLLEKSITNLKPAVTAFNTTAQPIYTKISDFPKQVTEFSEPVTAAYDKMPGFLKNVVAGRHSRFVSAVGSFQSFIGNYLDALTPVSSEAETNEMTTWLTSYWPDKRAFEQEQQRRQEEYERQQRQAEEERKRQEEEKRQQEETAKATELAAVHKLYQNFRVAYESRDAGGVLQLIDNNWQAAGMTIEDLEEQFTNMFDVFDEITYTPSGLEVTPNGSGRYTVRYGLVIVGKIRGMGLVHKEESTLNEEVGRTDDGRIKILRTLSGAFWRRNQ